MHFFIISVLRVHHILHNKKSSRSFNGAMILLPYTETGSHQYLQLNPIDQLFIKEFVKFRCHTRTEDAENRQYHLYCEETLHYFVHGTTSYGKCTAQHANEDSVLDNFQSPLLAEIQLHKS